MARSCALSSPSGFAQACIAQFTCQLRNTFRWTRRSGFLLSRRGCQTWDTNAWQFSHLGRESSPFFDMPMTAWRVHFKGKSSCGRVNKRCMKRPLCSPLQPAVLNSCASSESRLQASRRDSSSHDLTPETHKHFISYLHLSYDRRVITSAEPRTTLLMCFNASFLESPTAHMTPANHNCTIMLASHYNFYMYVNDNCSGYDAMECALQVVTPDTP